MNGVTMKSLFHIALRSASLSILLLLLTAVAAMAQDPRLQTSNLDYLTAKASQTVDVNIDERLVQMTAKFLSSTDPDEKKVKQLVSGLKGIYVKVFEFEREGEYTAADVESIRIQLRGDAWSRIISINSKRQGSVEVYLMTVNDQIGGLAVLAADPKELTIVNIIGPVDLNKLSELEGQFGVPELGIDAPAKTKTKN
jgi:hypothetical protein